jgi:hypothetical protein
MGKELYNAVKRFLLFKQRVHPCCTPQMETLSKCDFDRLKRNPTVIKSNAK